MSEAILAIRLRALGDLVLVTPALRALARGFPGQALEVVADARFAPVLEGAEGIARVWRLERTARAMLATALALRRRRYALAVDFFGNPRSAQLTLLSGARLTAGFDLRGRRYAYRVRVPRNAPAPHGGREQASEAHLRLARAVGGQPDGKGPAIVVPETARAAAAVLLERAGVTDPKRTIALVAAAHWPTRMWPMSHAASLSARLLEAGWSVLLLTGPGEESAIQSIRILEPRIRVLPPCGVAELMGVVARLGAVVGPDSGPRHLAAALGIPTFTWYGPTHPETWHWPGPLHGMWQTSLPCAGCDRRVCPHWSCLPQLEPAEAATRVLRHLEGRSGEDAALGAAARA